MKPLHHLTARELREQFASGKVSALEIASHFLERIDRINPKVGAFLAVFHERTRERAKALDEKRKRGEKLGRLAAVPVAIKDNIHIQGCPTTCASKILENYIAPFDATVTTLLEKEDALLIGKTNLDEFAMGSTTEQSAFLKTKNPWDIELVPGGSSGGSAAAVAARLAPLALGSDTGGSIRLPASFCNLVGMKPTYGRVSRFGLVAYGSSLDQIGPFATNCKDAALLLEIIGRPSEHDSTNIKEAAEELLPRMEKASISGLTIGIPETFLEGLKGDALKRYREAVETLKSLGAQTVPVKLDLLKKAIAIYYILATAEASTNLARFDGIRYGHRSKKAETLDEVYDLSKEEGYGQEVKRRILLGTYVLSAGYQDAYYKKAQKVRTLLIRQFEEAYKTCQLIAMPVSTGGAFKSGEKKDPLSLYLEDIYTIGANLAGLPAISIPAGMVEGKKPYGLQLLAPQKKEALLFEAAAAFEGATDFHHAIPELGE